jgi:hypothetical protein
VIKGFFERPGAVFALIYAWKIALFVFTSQPVPSNDGYFYDGPVVNLLLHGKYANPALALALPISATKVFCAYPPLYQLVLLGWMAVFGVSAWAAMAFHIVLFGVYMLLLLAIFRRLAVPSWAIHIGAAFLLIISFHDRPDSLAHVFGIAALYAWIRSRAETQPSAWLWRWAISGLLVFTFCTGLQIGALYIFFLSMAVTAATMVNKERFPTGPMLGVVLIPIALVALVIVAWPQLWEGFLEHARQTPAWTGRRWPSLVEVLKIGRTVPGVLLSALFLASLIARSRVEMQRAPQMLWIVTFTSTLAALAIVVGSAFFLTPNSVGFAAYLQPISVAGCLSLSFFQRYRRLRVEKCLFVLAAGVGAIRAIGMSTWGVACAADVSYSQAVRAVRQELIGTNPGQKVVLSGPYLYEGARHAAALQCLHSDWLARARAGQPDFDRQALIAVKPARLILTQFDFYRRYEPVLTELKQHPEIVEFELVNRARVDPPDAKKSLQKVVQHLSWAPVIVTFSWK